MKLKIVLKRGVDGYIIASVPALRGCWTQGRTKEEALRNIREAITLYLSPDAREVSPGRGRDIVELAI
ncbi:MAG: type II toxin-antitoxin system HicB family antitoxin [Candidatus Omnitrophica bacterium]|nr:type II toxin-antitoxin system HicB family antitoxin [Candidatus Omnitrophota bacterium]